MFKVTSIFVIGFFMSIWIDAAVCEGMIQIPQPGRPSPCAMPELLTWGPAESSLALVPGLWAALGEWGGGDMGQGEQPGFDWNWVGSRGLQFSWMPCPAQGHLSAGFLEPWGTLGDSLESYGSSTALQDSYTSGVLFLDNVVGPKSWRGLQGYQVLPRLLTMALA